jgi:hypothetical protein
MVATSPSLKREVEELIADQVRLFKQPVSLDERDLLEYHLRHYFIMTLYRELDRGKAVESRPRIPMKVSVAAANRAYAAIRV